MNERSMREGIAAVAVAELRDEEIVADQERRLHRAGRDIERMEQEGAEDERDQQRLDDDLDRLPRAALCLAFSLALLSATLMAPS